MGRATKSTRSRLEEVIEAAEFRGQVLQWRVGPRKVAVSCSGHALLVQGTFGISGRRELTVISPRTAPPPLRCIPWFVAFALTLRLHHQIPRLYLLECKTECQSKTRHVTQPR